MVSGSAKDLLRKLEVGAPGYRSLTWHQQNYHHHHQDHDSNGDDDDDNDADFDEIMKVQRCAEILEVVMCHDETEHSEKWNGNRCGESDAVTVKMPLIMQLCRCCAMMIVMMPVQMF